MSGSRFASGLQGFNTGLFPGLYPTRPALGLPTAPTPSTPAAPPAPAMPGAPAPVSVGSQPMMGGGTGPAMDTAQGSSPTDLGPNPGMIDGSVSGLGGWGTVGGALGALAGMALGAPGLGLAGAALGTGFDVQAANAGLREAGLNPSVGFGSAFANNMSFGALGSSVPQQVLASQGQGLASGGWDGSGFGAVPGENLGSLGAGYGGALAGLSAPPGPVDAPPSFDWGAWGGTGDNAQGPSTDGSANQGAAGLGTDVTAGATEGWRHGGYTGDNGDGRYDVAGVVHEGEVVLRPEAVKHYGLGPLLALNRMEVPPSRLAALMGGKSR